MLQCIGEFGEGRPDFGGRRPAGEAAGQKQNKKTKQIKTNRSRDFWWPAARLLLPAAVLLDGVAPHGLCPAGGGAPVAVFPARKTASRSALAWAAALTPPLAAVRSGQH